MLDDTPTPWRYTDAARRVALRTRPDGRMESHLADSLPADAVPLDPTPTDE